jgi:predicted nucleic acid-binding protein
MLRIYLDTNIWNAICNQVVDAKALLASLAAKNAALVISPHTVYELARTFTGKKPTGKVQGMKLFSCVNAFFDLDILCSKELMELLHEEVLA